MELKWTAIMVAIIFGGAAASMMYEDHTRNQCVQSYAASNRTTDEIVKICGVKADNRGSVTIRDSK